MSINTIPGTSYHRHAARLECGTSYSGNSTTVTDAGGCLSGGQTRTFTYDHAQRITQATNPESGTYTYSYVNSSNVNQIALQSRIDPRGFTTTYTYNAMDWLTGITYSDGTPNSSFTYNSLGHLTQSANGNVVNNYTSFDNDGRVTASNVQTQGVTYNFSYQYDLAGNLTTETYPSGRSLQLSYDIAGRQLTAAGTLSGATTNYVQSAGYYPDGHSEYAQYGSNLWSWQSVDNLLRPWQAWAL